MRPLTALCLVTSGGIGKLHLQGIVVAVGLDLLQAVSLQGNVGIVGHHLFEELFLLLMGQRRSLTGQCVEQHRSRQFFVVVVGERHGHLSKAEAIELVDVLHATHYGMVTIGEELQARARTPEVIVLHDHQQVARTQFFLTSQNLVADALVEDVGTFVGTCHHHRLVEAYPTIAARQRLDEFVAHHPMDVGKALEQDLW